MGYFLFIFATTVANTSSARARTKKSTQICQKSRFSTFALKIALFSLKTGAKAHTELQQGETSLTKQFPVEKGVFSKFSPTMSHLSDTFGHRGYIFTTLFLHIQTRQRHAVWTISIDCCCTCCPPKTMPLGRLHEKWE